MSELETVACRLLSEKQRFILAKIVSRQGSAPRLAGTKMLITREGQIYGTIGGGLLEASTIKAAMDVFAGEPPRFIRFDLTHEVVETMDMICGGETEVFLDLIEPSHENMQIFTRWKHALQNGETCYFTTVTIGDSKDIDQVSRCLIYRNGEVFGKLPDGALNVQELLGRAGESPGMLVITFDRVTMILEQSVKPKEVYIFGAGHVAQPVSQIASMVGFLVFVLDDRIEFANSKRFPDADEVRVIEDFDGALADLCIDEDAFIVILTRGHRHDKTVLIQALKTRAGYIGMISSRRKRDLIYQSLMEQGFTQEDLNRVHAPVGLSIGAETPEEIAVSIVAELIQKRAQLQHQSSVASRC